MQIGNLKLQSPFALAPMAGVTDLAFRQLCAQYGAGLVVTEMVSSRALVLGDGHTKSLMALSPDEAPVFVQLFGHEPDIVAQAAVLSRKLSDCDGIDINMGCPAPKIVNNGDGSALMKNPTLARQIVQEVRRAVDCPLTVKFRLGWDDKTRNAVEFARIIEQSGADAICVHGRTRSQQYSGYADWDAIAQVVQAVSIPVFANGDVTTAQQAVNIVKHTGAAGAMIGRGAMGNPFLFEQANALFRGEPLPPTPSLREKLQVAVRQVERATQLKGERIALLEARRTVGYYLRGQEHMKPYRIRVTGLCTLQDLYQLVDEITTKEED